MRRISRKIIAWLLTVIILISSVDGGVCAKEIEMNGNDNQVETEGIIDEDKEVKENNQDIRTESVYEGSNFKVTFSISDSWEESYNANITIENTGKTVINNWYLKFAFDEEIANIWNAEIDAFENGCYIIKNAGWNMNIPEGDKVSFGFVSSKKFEEFPSKYELIGENLETPSEEYTILYQLDNDWGEGFTGSISIKNNTDETLENWTLEFDFARAITNIWNGVIKSHEGEHYVIQNSSGNSNISAGQTVSFGFSGQQGDKENEPYNYVLYTHSHGDTMKDGDSDDSLNFDEDYLKVQNAISQLSIGYEFADTRDSVTSNLTLVTELEGVSIDWSSSNPDVLSNTGIVNRLEDCSQEVILKAVVSSNDYSETKEFKVNVIKSTYVNYDTDSIRDMDSLEWLYLYNDGDLDNLEVYLNDEGYISFISGAFSDIIVESPEEAVLALYGIRTLLGCKSPKDELQWMTTNKDNYGTAFRFEQIYHDVPIYGTSVVIATGQDGKTSSLQSSFVRDIQISTTPSLSEQEAVTKVTNSGYTFVQSDGLYIFMKDSVPNLAWNIYASDKNGCLYNILVHAATGEILLENSNENDEKFFGTTTGSGKSEIGGTRTFPVLYTKDIAFTKYTLRDADRNISVYDMENYTEKEKSLPGTLLTKIENKWEKDEVSAMTNVIRAYDFYKRNFGRAGIDNNNSEISVVIRDASLIDNSKCSGSRLIFGLPNVEMKYSGAAALDTVGHEYTHGVVHQTTSMVKYFRDAPGAVNEGYADIFGYFIEGDDDDEWLHREDNMEGKRALRNMSNPSDLGCAASVGGSYYIDYTLPQNKNADMGGVHQNSTIVSHACYLMWKNGIADKKRLADLWYHSLLLGYDINTSFLSVRINVLTAAKNMRMSADEIQTIKNAFDEVNIKAGEAADIKGTNIVTGKVVAADTDAILSNNPVLGDVSVSLIRTGVSLTGAEQTAALKSTKTSNDGIFNFNNIVPGTYRLTMSKSGYFTETQIITLTATKLNYYCNTVELISTLYAGYGEAGGTIVDSLTGMGVEGLDLKIRSGLNTTSGMIVKRIESQSGGVYETGQLGTGYYCIEVVDNRELEKGELSYYTTYFNIKVLGGTTISGQNATVSTSLNADQIRIVLEWGVSPTDLDSHLDGPKSDGGTFHIHYLRKEYKEEDTLIVGLDLDDTTSYGPETTTIYSPIEGEYIFYVYNYSGSPDISTSGATVKVYTSNSNEPEFVFNVPIDQSGRYWTVFKYDSKTKEIQPVNMVGSGVEK